MPSGMSLIPRKESVDEKESVSKVMETPDGMSRRTRVVVVPYASIVKSKGQLLTIEMSSEFEFRIKPTKLPQSRVSDMNGYVVFD